MRTLSPVAGLLLSAMLLAGCVPVEPTVTPAPEPSTTPVFASEEEALAAAEEAYAEYLRIEDAVAQEGGVNPQRLREAVTDEWLEKEVEVFEAFAATGNRQVGETSVLDFELQQLVDSGSLVEIVAYVCVDSTPTTFVDPSGADVTPSSRPATTSLQVTLEWSDSRSKLLIADSQPWSGESFC